MPPAVSDDEMESDGIDEVPAKGKVPSKADIVEDVDDEEEDDDDEPDEFRVEKIVKHDFGEDGQPIYQIKWLGYEKTSDRTWEPRENLENAIDILEEYHKSIGGEPVYEPAPTSSKKKGAKGGKRSASAAFAESPAAETSTKKRGRKSVENSNGAPKFELPDGSWQDHVLRVTSIIEEFEPAKSIKGAKGASSLIGLLEWNNGQKTQHAMKTLRTKCPQKLIDYYEQHLVFNHPDKD